MPDRDPPPDVSDMSGPPVWCWLFSCLGSASARERSSSMSRTLAQSHLRYLAASFPGSSSIPYPARPRSGTDPSGTDVSCPADYRGSTQPLAALSSPSDVQFSAPPSLHPFLPRTFSLHPLVDEEEECSGFVRLRALVSGAPSQYLDSFSPVVPVHADSCRARCSTLLE